jgi:hypothetical protein
LVERIFRRLKRRNFILLPLQGRWNSKIEVKIEAKKPHPYPLHGVEREKLED